jgi:hypothetical protein
VLRCTIGNQLLLKKLHLGLKVYNQKFLHRLKGALKMEENMRKGNKEIFSELN